MNKIVLTMCLAFGIIMTPAMVDAHQGVVGKVLTAPVRVVRAVVQDVQPVRRTLRVGAAVVSRGVDVVQSRPKLARRVASRFRMRLHNAMFH